MRKLSDMNNNIFTPQLVDVILPGCSIDEKNTNKLSDIKSKLVTKASPLEEPYKGDQVNGKPEKEDKINDKPVIEEEKKSEVENKDEGQ